MPNWKIPCRINRVSSNHGELANAGGQLCCFKAGDVGPGAIVVLAPEAEQASVLPLLLAS